MLIGCNMLIFEMYPDSLNLINSLSLFSKRQLFTTLADGASKV